MRPRQSGDVVERFMLGRVCDGACHPGFRSPSATSTLGFHSSGPSGRTRQTAPACDTCMASTWWHSHPLALVQRDDAFTEWRTGSHGVRFGKEGSAALGK